MATMMRFKPVEFFGGAMTAEIPEGFGDVSLIRQVPSHQELHLSATGLTSLLLEINERVDHLGSDKEALRYHLDDIVTPGESSHVWDTTNVIQLPNFPSPSPTLSLLATATPPPISQQAPPPPGLAHQPAKPSTALLLTLIRLLPQFTDLLLTINIPLHQPPSQQQQPFQINSNPQDDTETNFNQGNYGPLVREGYAIRDHLLRTLVVRDWHLFEGE